MAYVVCMMEKELEHGNDPSKEEIERFKQESINSLLALSNRCVVRVIKDRKQQPESIVAEFMSE